MMPLVSVLIPNYNHAAFLRQRIESVLEQSFQDFELILMDDCSTDESVQVLETYAKHPKVSHLLLNKTNSGSPFGMWSQALVKAKGKYIWIAESDDWAAPDFLQKLIPSFKDEAVVLAHCRSFDTSPSGDAVQLNSWWNSFKVPLWETDFVMEGRQLMSAYGIYKCPVINVSSAVFRASIVSDIEIPSTYRYCGDWWFWGQLFVQGDVSYVAEPLNYFRIHNASATGKHSANTLKRISENFKVIAQFHTLLEKPLKYNSHYDWLLQQLVDEAMRHGNYKTKAYRAPAIPRSFKRVYQMKLMHALKAKALKRVGL